MCVCGTLSPHPAYLDLFGENFSLFAHQPSVFRSNIDITPQKWWWPSVCVCVPYCEIVMSIFSRGITHMLGNRCKNNKSNEQQKILFSVFFLCLLSFSLCYYQFWLRWCCFDDVPLCHIYSCTIVVVVIIFLICFIYFHFLASFRIVPFRCLFSFFFFFFPFSFCWTRGPRIPYNW